MVKGFDGPETQHIGAVHLLTDWLFICSIYITAMQSQLITRFQMSITYYHCIGLPPHQYYSTAFYRNYVGIKGE